MSAIDEGIVREYFEQNGFFVRQVRKYQVQARQKRGDEEIDLLVYNPAWQRGRRDRGQGLGFVRPCRRGGRRRQWRIWTVTDCPMT